MGRLADIHPGLWTVSAISLRPLFRAAVAALSFVKRPLGYTGPFPTSRTLHNIAAAADRNV